jgi:hypothetical protein
LARCTEIGNRPARKPRIRRGWPIWWADGYAKLTNKVTLKAKATDTYGVAKVQLLVNGKVVATDTKAGYQFTLNPEEVRQDVHRANAGV